MTTRYGNPPDSYGQRQLPFAVPPYRTFTMRSGRSILLLLGFALALSGCGKKKVSLAPPPQAQAPAATPAATPPAWPSSGPPPPVNAEPNRPVPAAEPEKPKPRPRTNVARKTPPPAAQPAEDAQRTTPANAGQTSPSQLSAALSHDDVLHRKFTTSQLLEATEHNLKALTRNLSGDEQATVQHIRSYIQQARSATESGDVERAYNLALKAHLLSDELIKR
ncbi:MAG TPA: hypothetical protein VG892_07475 [Terriglobales bacterium]|nr:hypothetical protein [Terriglobales bacterium]